MTHSFWGGSIHAWPKDFIPLGYRCCIDRFVIANSSEVLWKYQVRIPFRLSKGDAIFLLSSAQVCCAIPLVLCFWNKTCNVLSCPALGAAPLPQGCRPGLPWAPDAAAGLERLAGCTFPWGQFTALGGISHCSAELRSCGRARCCSSCSKVVPPAGSTFLPWPQLELTAGTAAAATSGWERCPGNAWPSSKARYCTRKQPAACFYTSNHLSVVVFFLLVSVLTKKHKLKNCKVLQIHKAVLVLKSLLLQRNLMV